MTRKSKNILACTFCLAAAGSVYLFFSVFPVTYLRSTGIRKGMSIEQVTAILGPGTERNPGDGPMFSRSENVVKGSRMLIWTFRNNWSFVAIGFDDNKVVDIYIHDPLY